MRNAHPRYLCYPSVIQAGKESTITIFPRDLSRRFRDGKEYELCIMGLRDPEPEYYNAPPFEYPCAVKSGCLTFTYYFESEQEYEVRFREKGGESSSVSLYALEEDLYNLRPLKGDLHTHSYYSDGADGLTMVPADYREEGFDFYALTDHNRMFTSRQTIELYKDVPLGMHLMTGEEVHTPDSTLHLVHVGGTHSVCEQYILHRDTYEAEVDEIAATLTHIPESHRRKVAMAKWACTKIHEAGGISIFAHPFWQPRRFNVSRTFCDYLFDEKIFDAFEVMGGIKTKENNLQLALWQEQCAKGNYLPIVGTTDSHNHDYDTSLFARRFTIVFAKANTTEAILEAIKKGYSVAADLPPTDGNDVRFYGSLRLVLFSHFLFEHYFNETWRLCVGEGILMRRYAQGEPVGELLGALAGTVEGFYKKFYGLLPAPTLSPDQEAFLDECLEMQRTLGPITKGAAIYAFPGKERRE